MNADFLTFRDILATLVSGSLAFALVKSLETLAARGALKQVFLMQILPLEQGSTKREGAACLQEDCTHIHRPIVCPDMAFVQVLANNTVSQTLKLRLRL